MKSVISINSDELRTKSYEYFLGILNANLNDIDDADLSKYSDDKENLAFINFNSEAVDNAAVFVSEKKLKLNYDYQITWSIFVLLTFIALIVAFLLKMEDKRKGYGLQLPNIQS